MMLHRRTSIGTALVAMSIGCGTATAQDSSRITAVTLYPGSATVERSARVVPGMTRLEISGLPANFDPQTVRVESDAGVRIGEVSTKEQSRALERDLARLKSGAKDVRTIAVGVSAERPGEVRVSYQMNGAGWRPTYRAGLDSAGSKVLLERQGAISQTTGEDWTNVRLKLSTGQPRLSPQGTEPRPWKLSWYSPGDGALSELPYSRKAAAPAQATRQLADAPKAEAPIEVQTTFATEFEVPGAVNLPSDGRKLTVSLAKLSLPAKMRLRVVPRLDAAAVVTAEAERPEGVWLAGDIQLYRAGNYVGATSWNPQASASLVLPFGRDSLVRVKVDRAKDRSGSGGLIARRNEREVSDLFTLTSFHKAPVELLVLEASPVSTNDQIKVEAKFDPKPTEENWEERQGVVAWARSIAPNQTLKFSVGYAISYPKDGAVVGLP